MYSIYALSTSRSFYFTQMFSGKQEHVPDKCFRKSSISTLLARDSTPKKKEHRDINHYPKQTETMVVVVSFFFIKSKG